jgi:biopolymer transport protein ExbD
MSETGERRGGGAGDERPVTGINITPMVDVVLVLLIIFMATAPLLQKRALNIALPKSALGAKKATATLQLFFTADRKILIESTAFTAETLAGALQERMRIDPAMQVSVAADKSIPYGDVVGLLDVVRRAGVKKVALDVSTH